MFADERKHVLAFDMIYCCSVYGLFKGITYTKRSVQERLAEQENRQKAEQLMQEYEDACMALNSLQGALDYFVRVLSPGTEVRHKKFGPGEVTGIDKGYIRIRFAQTGEEKMLGLSVLLANKILTSEREGFEEMRTETADLLRRKDTIHKAAERLERSLKEYEKYLPDRSK